MVRTVALLCMASTCGHEVSGRVASVAGARQGRFREQWTLRRGNSARLTPVPNWLRSKLPTGRAAPSSIPEPHSTRTLSWKYSFFRISFLTIILTKHVILRHYRSVWHSPPP